VTIALLPGGTLNGVVVGRGTGVPIAGARVMARGDEIQPWQGFAAATATTGPEGSFILEGVPEKFALTVRHEEYAQAVVEDLSVPPGGVASVRVEMGTGGGLRGAVSRGGAPVAGAKVHASKQGSRNPSASRRRRTRPADSSSRESRRRMPAGGLRPRRCFLVAYCGRRRRRADRGGHRAGSGGAPFRSSDGGGRAGHRRQHHGTPGERNR
jgi:hypothetical protein